MQRKELYSAIFDGEYPFKAIFEQVTTVMKPEQISNEKAVLVLWGGGDISPTLYNHQCSSRTQMGSQLSYRDIVECELANKAVSMGIPIIGICRGAQLMCAISGGTLIQDVTGHTNSHNMIDLKSKEVIKASSLHHQMMYPWEIEHEIIAIATPKCSKHYVYYSTNLSAEIYLEDIPEEPEIVVFPQTKCLAIQGHPEFMRPDSRYVQYCFDLVRKYF